jgi:hypothetical protein
MKTQIFIDHGVLSCDSIYNCLCTGACGGISDLVLIADDAMGAVMFPLLAIFMHHC